MLQTCKKIGRAIVLILAWPLVHAATPAIQVTFLSTQQDIPQILKLQQKLTMSKKPKEISSHPRATCFSVNINHFLPVDSKTKPIYGCIFSDQVTMNAALLRAGLYVHTDLGLASDAQLFNSKLMSSVGGHDFSGQELLDYCKKAHIPTETLPEHQDFKAIEQEFHRQVIQPILNKNQGDFIFFAVINTKRFKENLSHELLHAQYYNTPQIATVLQQVWQDVPKKDQDIIVNALRDGGYDMNQQELLLREFYSYFLQYNASKYLANIPVLKPMAPLAKIYAPKIRAALQKQHITILTVVK